MEEELYRVHCRYGEFPDYLITKSGKMFSLRQGSALKPLSVVLDSSGYPIVKLYSNDRKAKTIAVHRIVADMFLDNPNPSVYDCINHKDEVKTNCNVENLEWCTKTYNNTYGSKAAKIGIKLQDSNPRKRAVNQIKDGVVVATYKSVRAAGRALGNPTYDSNIHSGIRTGQERYGYMWKFVTD